ncbi:sulfotransferase family protein [Aquisphaera insulae]|uniref:sulfotransferase family protein n=1 Tax=Aquisphaera insulae TaxID=2712864 RepID=UPI0021109642|nr:sulfotransferase [Aquisphaera insulae]
MDLSRLYFVVGPLRTGSSLMSRCLDDHPSSICLCESEINRALFRDYFLKLHADRMVIHGFSLEEVVRYVDRRKQDSPDDFLRWFADIWPRATQIYGKPDALILGDKSPDFFRSPELIRHLVSHCRLIYTVRDPRAIFRSIDVQTDASPAEKEERWGFLIQNYLAWRPHLDSPNLLTVRYEDLVGSHETTMTAVYAHLGLPYSPRYLESFGRAFPRRFLWTTAIDWETGIRKDFDPGRASSWRRELNAEQLDRARSDPAVRDFMDRFGYEY